MIYNDFYHIVTKKERRRKKKKKIYKINIPDRLISVEL